jgi:hypothetical protein
MPKRAVDHLDRKGVEGVVNEFAGPGGHLDERRREGFREVADLLVGKRPLGFEVLLVYDEIQRHVSRDLQGSPNPFA